MCLLGIGEFLSRVLAEIGLQKALGFRQREVKIRQRLHPQPQLRCGAVEKVSAVLAVLENEVEMVSSKC